MSTGGLSESLGFVELVTGSQGSWAPGPVKILSNKNIAGLKLDFIRRKKEPSKNASVAQLSPAFTQARPKDVTGPILAWSLLVPFCQPI